MRTPLPSTLLLLALCLRPTRAQQSAAGQDTLLGIVGRDFVMMGADTSSSGGGGIALTSSSVDKIAVIHDGGGVLGAMSGDQDGGDRDVAREGLGQQAIAVGFAGDAADADRMMGTLRTHVQVKEYEAGIGNDVSCVFDGRIGAANAAAAHPAPSPAGMDAEALAHFSRYEIASRMRSRQPLNLCLLVGGMVRCDDTGPLSSVGVADRVQKQISVASDAYKLQSNNLSAGESDTTEDADIERPPASSSSLQRPSNRHLAPKLFWLDQYGSLQNMRYAAHGYGSNFAYSVLDQGYRNDMSRQEVVELLRECFAQLRQRYVINSPRPPRIKCIDVRGVSDIAEEQITKGKTDKSDK